MIGFCLGYEIAPLCALEVDVCPFGLTQVQSRCIGWPFSAIAKSLIDS